MENTIMSITLYTAPDCMRCKIVKGFMAAKDIEYGTVDFKADAQVFNTFYRTNRKAIYRNPEGVEFPLFDDGNAIKQGSGEIIAYLLAGHDLEGAVTRSDLLHGWISGLYLSQCPDQQENNFVELVEWLAKGGLSVCLQSDGRKPHLLQRLLESGHVSKVQLNILGPAAVYEKLMGSAPSQEDLAESIRLVRTLSQGEIRFLASPIMDGDEARWPEREEAAAAAKMVFDACGDHTLPYVVTAVTPEMPQGMQGLTPADDALMFKYRSASRQHLFKADIQK